MSTVVVTAGMVEQIVGFDIKFKARDIAQATGMDSRAVFAQLVKMAKTNDTLQNLGDNHFMMVGNHTPEDDGSNDDVITKAWKKHNGSLQQITMATGLKREVAIEMLQERNLPFDDHKRTRINQGNKTRTVEELLDLGYTESQIAMAKGMTKEEVIIAMARLGVLGSVHHRDAEVRELYEEGYTIPKICMATGLKKRNVLTILAVNGLI